MRTTIGEIRKIIRETLRGSAGSMAKGRLSTPGSGGVNLFDREQLGKISAQTLGNPNEISPHLRDETETTDDIWGPVPPGEDDPKASSDPFSKDYHVIPTPPIKR